MGFCYTASTGVIGPTDLFPDRKTTSAEERTEYRDGWFRLVARAKARNMVMRARQKSLGQTTETILKDLKLFGSLCIAQFIVWRTMRRK
jgi:hypothetical protein